jgi:hypothetical protein
MGIDVFGVGKLVAGVVNGFGRRKLRKVELENALHVKQLEGVQAIDASVHAVQLAQIAVNKAEANHKSLFVAGGRPFIMWVCGIGLAYNTLLHPVLDIWLEMPTIDVSLLYPVLMGILGLGGMRSWEKSKGVAREI